MKVSENQGEFEHKDVYRNLMYSKGDYRFKGENGFDDAVGACTGNENFTPSTEPEPGPGPGPTPPTPSSYWGLTFTAVEAGSTIRMISVDYTDTLPKLQTSFDGKTWTPFIIDETTITLPKVGDKVYFAATDEGNDHFNTKAEDTYIVNKYNKFVMTGKIAASGDVTSLLDNKNSVTDLSNYPCVFGGLFYGCSSLTTPPILPATVLSANCYDQMFSDCTSLVSAPELPAMTLEPYCYNEMFYNCESITKIVLPAPVLVDHCYRQLFANYNINMQLNEVTVGFTEWLNDDDDANATYEWMSGMFLTSGTFKCPTALGTNETIERGYSHCPDGWTVENI